MTDLACDVCDRPAVGVASSTLGAISLAYCSECLKNNADATWLVEFTIGCCGPEPESAASWFRDEMTVWRGGGEYVLVRDAYPPQEWKRIFAQECAKDPQPPEEGSEEKDDDGNIF